MRYKLYIVSTALLAASAAPLCQGATWWRLPVWGADVRVLAVDPFEPGRVTCGTSRGNFYDSTDGGATWTPLRPGPAFPGYIVSGLVPDPGVAGRLFASLEGQYTGGLVARSDDRGLHWTVLARWEKTIPTRALAVAFGSTPILAVGGDDGVYLSKDGGATWTRARSDTPGPSQVESLAFDPSDPKTLYAGTWRQGFRSKDGGQTWSRIAEGMVLDATIYSWDFDRGNPRDIWVSTCGWVYHTTDGGDHWTRSKNGFTNRRSHTVRRDPKRPGVIYAATVGGLHRSNDGGQSWARVSRESLVVKALEVDPRSGRLYVGTEGEGVFFSDDAGSTLANGSVGLAEGRVTDLVADPNDSSRVFFFRAYAGEESGVWQAEGLRVRRVSSDPLPAAASLAAFRDAAGKTLLVLSSSSGVRLSRDRGEHWRSPEAPPAGTPIALVSSPFPTPILVTSAGVFRASDDGRGFQPIPGAPSAPTGAELLSDQTGSPLLEVRTAGGLQRWNGQVWSTRRLGILKGGVFFQEGAGVAAAYSTLEDVGGTLIWQEGGRRLSLTAPRPGLALATAAAAPGGLVYLGTSGDGLFLFQP